MKPSYKPFVPNFLTPQEFVKRVHDNAIAMANATCDRHNAEILILSPIVKAYCQSTIYSDGITTFDIFEKLMGLTVQVVEVDNTLQSEAMLLARDCVYPKIRKGEDAYPKLHVLTRPMALRKFSVLKES